MKMLMGLLAMTLSVASLANTGETRTINYDGSQNSIELVLRGEQTHTEYRVEDVQSTCYRQEIAGYQTICTGGYGYPGGYPGGYYGPGHFPGGYYDPRYPRPYPGPYGRRHCYSQPIYRSVPYSCMRTVKTPYQVKDYDVEARVVVDITKASELVAAEKIKVTLKGDKLTLTAEGSKNYLIVLKNQQTTPTVSGSVKLIDASYGIEMVEAAPLINALSMTSISIENGVLNFDLGPVTARENLALSLTVARKKLGSDPVLFDRDLTASEVKISRNGHRSLVEVDVENLGVELGRGKYALTAKASVKTKGAILNRVQFGELSASRTLIYSIR